MIEFRSFTVAMVIHFDHFDFRSADTEPNRLHLGNERKEEPPAHYEGNCLIRVSTVLSLTLTEFELKAAMRRRHAS